MTGMKTIFVGAMVLPVLWYIYRRDGKAGRRPPDRSTGTEVRVFVVAAVLFFLYYMAVSMAVNLSGLPENDAAFREAWETDPISPGLLFLWAVVLAPVLEELMFRGGVFGLLRRWNRYLAYGLCMLLFAMYHTWQYALTDPIFWLYLLQYLPAGYILCRSYEKTECIWTAILLPMLNNTISLLALGG